MMPPPLRRVIPLAAAILAAGLAVRFLPVFPAALRDALGGVCYTLLVAVLLRATGLRPGAAAAGALAWSCSVELLQLWHPAWLDSIRATLPGRLVLGTTFGWGDFPPYFAGALAAWRTRAAGQA